MGKLIGRRIVQSRIWINPEQPATPELDYEFTYPITVFDAVHVNTDENSATLTKIIEVINENINARQKLISGGTPGNVMVWTNKSGVIGEAKVVTSINPAPDMRSTTSLVTEAAVGECADKKLPTVYFENHIRDVDPESKGSHVSDTERTRWNNSTPSDDFKHHTENGLIHISEEERKRWNSMISEAMLEAHLHDYNNPHRTTAADVNTYDRDEIDSKIAEVAPKFFNYKNIKVDLIAGGKRNYALDIYKDYNKDPAIILDYHSSDIITKDLETGKYSYTGPDGVLHVMDDSFEPSQVGVALPDNMIEAFALVEKYPSMSGHYPNANEVQIWRWSGITGETSPWEKVAEVTVNTGDLFVAPDFMNGTDPWMYVWMTGRFIRLLTGKDDNTKDYDALESRVKQLEEKLGLNEDK